jgi:hypothetical protein
MSLNLGRIIVADFLKNSWTCVENLVKEVSKFKEVKERKVRFFSFKNGQKSDCVMGGEHFFLRGSVEYSNPQLTVEEVQGIIAVKMLEACGNYFHLYGLHEADENDINQICEMLNKHPQGKIVAFLLNTDEVEPDRYSMNPLKESIVKSGQSALPSISVKTEALGIDQKFVQKYEGSLISRAEADCIAQHLRTSNSNYLDMVDAVKYEQLGEMSKIFGMDLRLYSLRMPLTILEKETANDLLHHVIQEVHTDYQSVEKTYDCMGRSMKERTTLLTVPHSKKGYGSKRAARGKIYFDGTKLKNVKVTYHTRPLYPNAIDPNDVSVAEAEDSFVVEGDKLTNYAYSETPSSPQFFLYSLGSPENAVLWHGIGAFGASELLKSYATVRQVCAMDSLIRNLQQYGVSTDIPLQFNLVPSHMWFHPVHRNIDASIGCIDNMEFLAKLGMRVEYLSGAAQVRN